MQKEKVIPKKGNGLNLRLHLSKWGVNLSSYKRVQPNTKGSPLGKGKETHLLIKDSIRMRQEVFSQGGKKTLVHGRDLPGREETQGRILGEGGRSSHKMVQRFVGKFAAGEGRP